VSLSVVGYFVRISFGRSETRRRIWIPDSPTRNVTPQMACLNTLKQEIKTLESVFPKSHERFQIMSASVDELSCRFVGKNGKKYEIHANITVSVTRARGLRGKVRECALNVYRLVVCVRAYVRACVRTYVCTYVRSLFRCFVHLARDRHSPGVRLLRTYMDKETTLAIITRCWTRRYHFIVSLSRDSSIISTLVRSIFFFLTSYFFRRVRIPISGLIA